MPRNSTTSSITASLMLAVGLGGGLLPHGSAIASEPAGYVRSASGPSCTPPQAIRDGVPPPEVKYSCGAGDHRAIAVCHSEATERNYTVFGPWVPGGATSIATCGETDRLVDAGGQGGQ